VFALLYIPWFRLEAWRIPFPVIGELPIQPFGVLVATGVLLGAKYAEKRAVRMGISPRVVADLAAHIIVSGFVFGHVLDSIFYYPDRVARDPLFVLQIWNGLSSFGGFTGGMIGAFIWRIRRRMSVIAVGDAAAFVFPLGWMFGRTGCFVVHDHPGRVTDFPLAVADYHVGVPPYEPRHDLGFYEVIWSATVFSMFLLLGRKPRKPGFYVGLLPVLYAPIRFGLDFLRATPEDGGDIRYFGLTPGHYAAVLLGLIGSYVLWRATLGPGYPLPDEARLSPESMPPNALKAQKRPS